MNRFLAGIAALAIAASGVQVPTGWAAGIEDATGQIVKADDISRLLSIGGDTTEIVYALGFGDNVVAVDTTSQFPAAAMTKTKVGYMRALSTEGVLSTGATLILANSHAGPPEVVRALKGSSVPVVILPENVGPDSLVDKVRLVGRVLGAEAKAGQLAAELEKQFHDLANARSRIDTPRRAIFVLSVSSGRALVAGSGTTADVMLGLAGVTNAAASLNGYKPVSDEALIELAPEVIIAAHRTPDEDTVADIAALAGFKTLGAGGKVPVITMDASYLLGFGPRAPEAASELMTQVYAERPQ